MWEFHGEHESFVGDVELIPCGSPPAFKDNAGRWIYHYTDVDALKKILANGTLRFSRIDMVDDGKEARAFPAELAKKFYVSCWTCDERDRPFGWRGFYTSRNTAPSRRLRIAIRRKPFLYMRSCIRSADGRVGCLPIEMARPFRFADMHTVDYSVSRFNMAKSEWFGGKVKYVDDVELLYAARIRSEGGGLLLDRVQDFGMHKDHVWSDQEEYRFVLMAGPRIHGIGCDDKSEIDITNWERLSRQEALSIINCWRPSVEHIDMPLHPAAIADMQVLLTPLAPDSDLSEIRALVRKHCPLGGVERSTLAMTY